MPIKIQNDLPVRQTLEEENIFVVDALRALHQDIRPLQICILNLMPIKEETELQLLRALSNTPLQIDVSFMYMSTHNASNTSPNHLNRFYHTFSELKENTYDGLIITGAPVEQMAFEEVDYWPELCEVFAWSQKNVTSTFHICWGAQAGVYYHYGINKVLLKEKLFGVFHHSVEHRKVPLIRGFDDDFLAPHSRYTTVPGDALRSAKGLVVLAESEEAGVLLCMDEDGRNIFVFGHAEYDRLTLDGEYKRDRARGLDTALPVNYYPQNDETKEPLLTWRAHCNTLYTNWVNYYVYQATPYQWGQILDKDRLERARAALTKHE